MVGSYGAWVLCVLAGGGVGVSAAVQTPRSAACAHIQAHPLPYTEMTRQIASACLDVHVGVARVRPEMLRRYLRGKLADAYSAETCAIATAEITFQKK